MTAFNVVNRASMVAGQPEDISPILANFDALATLLNGNLDNSNLSAAAAILASKISGYPASGLKFLKGDGTWDNFTVISAPAMAAGVNDVPLGSLTAPVQLIRVSNAAAFSIRGIQQPTSFAQPMLVFIENVGAGLCTLTNAGAPAAGYGSLAMMANASATIVAQDVVGFMVFTNGAWIEVSRTKTMPAAHVRMPTQSIPSGAFTALAGWNTSDWLQGGMVLNANGVVVPEAGIYAVSLYGFWATSSAGAKDLSIAASGGGQVYSGAKVAGEALMQVQGYVSAPAGSQISVTVSQNSGAPNNFQCGAGSTAEGLAVVRVA